MGLTYPGLEAVKTAADRLSATTSTPLSLISFSYQDLIVSQAQLKQIVGVNLSKVKYREDSEPIVRWHKCSAVTTKIPETHSVYRALGFERIVDADLVKARNDEVKVDLNEPLPASLGRFDLVIDNVSQHCFNIGQALKSILLTVKPNGWVIHCVPLTMINQGYYSISPCALHDLYSNNGFEVVKHKAYKFDRLTGNNKEFNLSSAERMSVPDDNCFQIFLARSIKQPLSLVWPKQNKFIKHPHSTIHKKYK